MLKYYPRDLERRWAFGWVMEGYIGGRDSQRWAIRNEGRKGTSYRSSSHLSGAELRTNSTNKNHVSVYPKRCLRPMDVTYRRTPHVVIQ